MDEVAKTLLPFTGMGWDGMKLVECWTNWLCANPWKMSILIHVSSIHPSSPYSSQRYSVYFIDIKKIIIKEEEEESENPWKLQSWDGNSQRHILYNIMVTAGGRSTRSFIKSFREKWALIKWSSMPWNPIIHNRSVLNPNYCLCRDLRRSTIYSTVTREIFGHN